LDIATKIKQKRPLNNVLQTIMKEECINTYIENGIQEIFKQFNYSAFTTEIVQSSGKNSIL